MRKINACAGALYLLLLASCGASPADMVTQHGARFHFNGLHPVTLEVANQMEAKAIDIFQTYYEADSRDINDCLWGMDVDIQAGTEGAWYTDSTGTAGYYDALTANITLTTMECPWRTAYVHEVIHQLQWCVLHIDDHNHLSPAWADIEVAEMVFHRSCQKDDSECPYVAGNPPSNDCREIP